MNLILHIGTEKTGTTSIQQFLKKNKDRLKQNGVYIPQSPMAGNGNHRWLPLIANDASLVDDFSRAQQFMSQEERKRKICQKRNQFLYECQDAANECKTLILSSEHFQSRLRREEEIDRLRDLLEEVSDKICVVIYIRDPLNTAISLLSTSIKSGGLLSSLPDPSNPYFEHVCDHDRTINKWRSCFPEADLVVRRFDRRSLIDGDVVTDFCSMFVPNFDKEDYELTNPANETLSLTGMKLLLRLNLQFPRFVDNKPNPMRGAIAEFVMKNTSDGSKFLPCKHEYEAYEDRFAVSCENVRSHYFPLENSLFSKHEQFASDQIDLNDYEIDSQLCEKLINDLWERIRRLELKL